MMEDPTSPFKESSEYLEYDHRRIEQLLQEATEDVESVEISIYDQFRSALLRHISIEEKIVLPLLRKYLPGGFPMEAQLRLEHGAIAALLVPPPEPRVIFGSQGLLIRHNGLEEAFGTLYDLLDDCVRRDEADIHTQIVTHPDVPISRFINNPLAIEPARRAVARAGYDLERLAVEGKRAREEM